MILRAIVGAATIVGAALSLLILPSAPASADEGM